MDHADEPTEPMRPANTAQRARSLMDCEFDSLTASLRDGADWRWRVRRVHARHVAGIVGRRFWSGLADLGCWFAAVPPQRCAGRRPAD